MVSFFLSQHEIFRLVFDIKYQTFINAKNHDQLILALKWYHSLLCIDGKDKNVNIYDTVKSSNIFKTKMTSDKKASNFLEPIYSIVKEYLSNGYAVIYAVEPDKTQVVIQMNRNGIDAENFIENGSLVVIDSKEMYLRNNLDSHHILDFWHAILLKLRRENNKDVRFKSKGVLAIGTATVFLENSKIQNLVSYEELVGKKFEIPFEAICCYQKDLLKKMDLKTLISIIRLHQFTIHDGRIYREWSDEKIFNIIYRGIDKKLGPSSSKLVIKTLRLLYKVDSSSIILQPEIFENSLKKLFKESSNQIVQSIVDELQSEISY